MKEIMCKETNFSNSQIKKVKPFIKDFGFDGGYIFYTATDKNITKLKSILGKSIIKISGLFLTIFLLASTAHAGLYGRIEGGKDVDTENIYFTAVNIGYKFSVFGIQSRTFGGWKSFTENNNPFSDTYLIGQAFHFRGFYAQVDHYCSHRVVSTTHQDNNTLYRTYRNNPQAMTSVKIGYEWEIK